MATAKVEKYLLKKSMHLGYIRQSFPAGTVIEKNLTENKLVIDGRSYDSTKDLEILLSHSWATKYDAKLAEAIAAQQVQEKQQAKLKPETKETIKKQPLEVIESDQDLNEDIDISHTKTANNKNKKIGKNDKLEVIRGDEPAEERLARLQSEIPKLPVVEDTGDYGREGNGPSLNSGTVKIKTAAEHQAAREAALKKAEAKKAELAAKKASSSNVTVVESDKLELQTVEQAAQGNEDSVNTETIFENVDAPQATQASETTEAPKRSRGRPKGAKNKVAQTEGAV